MESIYQSIDQSISQSINERAKVYHFSEQWLQVTILHICETDGCDRFKVLGKYSIEQGPALRVISKTRTSFYKYVELTAVFASFYKSVKLTVAIDSKLLASTL